MGGRGNFFVVVAGLLVAAAVPATAGAAPPAISHAVDQTAAEVREYWTPARMRAAKPLALKLAGDRGGRSTDPAEPIGKPSLVLPTVPGEPAPRAGLVESLLPGGGAEPLAAVDQGGDNEEFPDRVHGKVFVTFDGTDYVCSGTAVASPGRSMAVSAGHCVFDNGFGTNWMFVPGLRDTRRPFGEWVARRLAARPEWRNNGNFSYDVGIATLRRNRNGEGIEDVIGARGIAFNQDRDQTFKAYGYPATPTLFRPDFNGRRLFACVSGRTDDHNPPGQGPDMIEIECDMTGGSSGGSWVIDNRYVNSVVSLGSALPGGNFLDGPYFGPAIKDLYEAEQGRTVRCGGARVTNLGTAGVDEFEGNDRNESMKLRKAADTARGRGGSDRLCGGRGADLLIGGPGFDRCYGGPGRDRSRGCEDRSHIP